VPAAVVGAVEVAVVDAVDDSGFVCFEPESSEHATSNAAAASRAINGVVRGT
jgi:hypothetical protein